MKYNIIADVAGRYNELQKLIEIMPIADKIILVGDLMDRGPDSKKVVEWAMKTPNVITIKGNHEDMMVESFYDWTSIDHKRNGGFATQKSYGINNTRDYPEDHINWMEKLPLFYRDKELFVSHAPWIGKLPIDNDDPVTSWEHAILWNRYPPKEEVGAFQIFGHNALMEKFDDFAICIDDCGNKKLTGITWPGKNIFQIGYEG